ncbi:MAG: hypothetical protein KA965_11635 [Butyrivibrio sp.]|nr:hypothetical protein [Butyrivibrio sp.]
MGIIRNIICDYENLIKTQITIPLESGDIIEFEFHPQDLPHLLGLQHLVDNPVLFEYSQKRLSATDLYKGMCNGNIDVDEFEKSSYFEELFQNRIKYFSSAMIMDIIRARQIVEFDPKKIKDFVTKMSDLSYIFWKLIRDENNNYGYFGVGFMARGNKFDRNYPNTFFFRSDNQYIFNQKIAIPMSLMITDRMKRVILEIYWEEIRASMYHNPHYKYLNSSATGICDEFGKIKQEEIYKCEDENIKRHYQLLRTDELNKAYLPYMDDGFRWTNDEKCYILAKIDQNNKVLYPKEINVLLNKYRQKINKKECITSVSK